MARKLGSTTIPECLAVQKSLLRINLGVGEYKLSAFKRGDTVTRVRLIAKTPDSKKAIQLGSAEKQLRKTCDGLLDVEVAGENTLDLRFAEKQRPGRKPKAQLPVKPVKRANKAPRAKGLARKVGHAKLSRKSPQVSRLAKLRVPRNVSPNVKHIFHGINEVLGPGDRASFLKEIAKYVPQGSGPCKEIERITTQLSAYMIVAKSNLSEAVVKHLFKHSEANKRSLLGASAKPRKRRAKRA